MAKKRDYSGWKKEDLIKRVEALEKRKATQTQKLANAAEALADIYQNDAELTTFTEVGLDD